MDVDWRKVFEDSKKVKEESFKNAKEALESAFNKAADNFWTTAAPIPGYSIAVEDKDVFNPSLGKKAVGTFDVIIGKPERNNPLNSITYFSALTTGNKTIFLEDNSVKVQVACNIFSESIRSQHHKLSVFDIDNGRYNVLFESLWFGNVGTLKLRLSRGIESHHTQMDYTNYFNEIGRNYLFFILGEFEIDEIDNKITAMEIESLGYCLRPNKDTIKMLVSVV